MKRVTNGVILFALIVGLLAISLLVAGVRHAHAIPLSPGCINDGCDGFKPPNFTNCSNLNALETTIYIEDKNFNVIGQLQTRYSPPGSPQAQGCQAAWGAIEALNNQSFQVTAIGIWESGSACDNDSSGTWITLPVNIGNGTSTNWVSTLMTGDCGSGSRCYHAALDYKDAFGVSHGPINTDNFCP